MTLPTTMKMIADKAGALLKDTKTGVQIVAQTYPKQSFESINDLASQLYGGFVSQYGKLDNVQALAYYIASTKTINREFAFSVIAKNQKEMNHTVIVIDDNKGAYHIFSISGAKPDDNTSNDFNTNISDIYYLIAGTFKLEKG